MYLKTPNNVIDAFLEVKNKYPDKDAFIDQNGKITFNELYTKAKSIASYLIDNNIQNENIGILLNRSKEVIIFMLGIMLSRNVYVVLDSEAPQDRTSKIIKTAMVKKIFTDFDTVKNYDGYEKDDLIDIKDVLSYKVNEVKIEEVKKCITSSDPVYILFTSGSTGMPKGTVINHKNILSYINWVSTEFDFNDKTIFGSQTPFYFSMSTTDVYSTLLCGATLVVFPKTYFSFPVNLAKAMNDYKVNTIYFVPSAYNIIASFKLFKYVKFDYLEKALFAGEVMSPKILNYWMEYYPNCLFANLFGPTETTDICTFYKVDRHFDNDESLPIGFPCHNLDVFLIDEGKKVTEIGKPGELYVKGDFVGMGYFNNKEKTNEAFVQNPLHDNYPDICYRTGDICKYNERGELIYLSRKDFQIKHMGYRIELGEIEAAANSFDDINNALCLYDMKKDNIILIYNGKMKEETLLENMKAKVPYYMMPQEVKKEKEIKYNQNGKIDRSYYKELYLTK